jgi:hypothetical protein
MGEAPRRLTTPRRTLLHAAARHDPFEQRTLVYHEDVAESLDLGDSVRHEVDAIEIGGSARPRRCIRHSPGASALCRSPEKIGFEGSLHRSPGAFQGSAQEQEQDHSIRNAIKDRFGSNRGIALFEAKGHEMSEACEASPQGQCLKLAQRRPLY